ncbi:hypothetical protein JCM13664_02950 [Methylothermus subterraneus]
MPSWAQPKIKSISLNSNPVPKYEKLELTIVTEGLKYNNPYNPHEVDLRAKFISPSGKKWLISGFYDGKHWKIRFTANETGLWRYRVGLKNHNDIALSVPDSFIVTESARHGWLRVSSIDPYYLIHDDGTPFFGIGQAGGNSKPLWFVENAIKTIRDMGNHGLNTLLIWWGPFFPLESEGKDTENTGVGRYDQSQARQLDRLVEAAEEHNVILIPVLWSHNQFYNRFSYSWSDPTKPRRNPYRHLHNGKLRATEWATDAESWEYQKRLYRYIIARWSYSTAIGIWGLFSELNLSELKNGEAWLKKIYRWFRVNDPFKHPTTASLNSNKIWYKGYSILDVASFHSYNDNASLSKNTQILVNAITHMRQWTKPNFIGEYGVLSKETRLKYVVDANWAATMSGSAMTPLYWWMANDRYSSPPGSLTWKKYLEIQKIISEFVNDIPFGRIKLWPVKPGKDVYLNSVPDGFRLSAPNKTSFSITLTPKSEWKIPENLENPIIIIQEGNLTPNSGKLNAYLHGRAHRNMQQSVEFVAHFDKRSQFIIDVDSYSRSGATLRVNVENKTTAETIFPSVFPSVSGQHANDYIVNINKSYLIPIPSGIHSIKVLNSGPDWIRIKAYRFKNVIPLSHEELDRIKYKRGVFGLKGKDRLYLYIRDHKIWSNGLVKAKNLKSGLYRIQWWDTEKGFINATQVKPNSKGEIIAVIPKSDHGIACKIELIKN